jgi:chemotaxis protein MotB
LARGLFDNSREASSPADSAAGKPLEKKKLPQMPLPKRKSSSEDEVGGGGGGGHESDETLWLYSFNDMLFNLLLFFIVMYSISQIDEKKFAEVQQALQGDKKPALLKDDDKEGVVVGPRNGALDAKQLASSGGEAGGDKSAEIAAAIRFMLERSEKAKVKLAKGAGKEDEKKEEQNKKKSKYLSGSNIPLPMKLVFPHTEFFQKGTADLSPQGVENLTRLAEEIKAVEKLGRADIEVHTEFSRDMIADLKGQSQLSTLKIATLRAGVMFEYFVKGGVPHKKVVSAGYADGRPIVLGENLTPQQRADFSASNDRVIVNLLMEKGP